MYNCTRINKICETFDILNSFVVSFGYDMDLALNPKKNQCFLKLQNQLSLSNISLNVWCFCYILNGLYIENNRLSTMDKAR